MKTRTLPVGTAALGAVAVGLTTPAAQADGQDDAFLAALAAQGVPAISGTKDLIRTGHEICADLGGAGSVAVDVGMRSNASPNESRVHTVEVVERVPTHADVVGGRCAGTWPWP
jgi:hypothetical protein